MKKCKKCSALIAGVLIAGGLVLLACLMHNYLAAESASEAWLWGTVGVAPILIGGAWLGFINHRRRCHRRGRFLTGRGNGCDCRGSERGERRERRVDFRADFRGDAIAQWRRQQIMAAILCGIGLIAFGVGVMLWNSGWLAAGWSRVFISWQMLLIVIGFAQLCRGNGIWATVLMLAGGFWIAPKVAAMFPQIFETSRAVGLLPVILIGVGIIVVLGAVFHSRGNKRVCGRYGEFDSRGEFNCDPNVPHEEVTTGDGRINENLRFGGMDKVILDPVFRGGNITVRGAGAVLDLRRTSLPEGETVLNIDISWGGVSIVASSDWHIDINSDCSFGGFVDKRSDVIRHDPQAPKLTINVHALFGGGQVTSTR